MQRTPSDAAFALREGLDAIYDTLTGKATAGAKKSKTLWDRLGGATAGDLRSNLRKHLFQSKRIGFQSFKHPLGFFANRGID